MVYTRSRVMEPGREKNRSQDPRMGELRVQWRVPWYKTRAVCVGGHLLPLGHTVDFEFI